ncbi:MAG: hypothetical protein PGN07_09995 [Aeromicrobium erythreum]
MPTVTDAQSWTLIIGFLTTTFAVVGVVTTSLTRTMRAEIGSVRAEIGSVRGDIDGLRTEMRTEFRRVDQRLDHLDRDVQALTRHVFDRPE